MPFRRRTIAAMSVLGVAVAAGPAAATAPAVLPAGRTYTVTLLTGDVVTVQTTGTGCPQVTVKPAAPNGCSAAAACRTGTCT